MKQSLIILLILVIPNLAMAQPTVLRSGDVILTRNSDQVGNPNGYFNHAAMAVETHHGMIVVEMQRDFDGCIAVTGEAFFRRYPEYCVCRHHDQNRAAAAARFAWSQIGVPRYGALASARPFPRGNRDNCVSLIRRSYRDVGLPDPGWIKPDGIYKNASRSGFYIAAHFRYDDYVPPQYFFEGLIP